MEVSLFMMLLLLVGSGFFSGVETAIFSLTTYQQKKLSDSASRGGKTVAELLASPQKLLTTILVGSMLVNTLYASMAVLAGTQAAERYGEHWALIIDFAALLLLIFIGEIVPKTLALSFAEPFSLWCARPLYVVRWLFGPVTRAVQSLDFVSRKRSDRQRAHFSAEDLEFIVQDSKLAGIIDADESRMLTEVMYLAGARVKEIMTPQTDLVLFDLSKSRQDFTRLVADTQMITIPVWQNHKDNIKGMIDAREAMLNPDKPFKDLLRPPLYIPETASVESLLKNFRRGNANVALVVDEYGNVVGIVSVRDIAERIVGEIQEEDEEASEPIRQIGPRQYVLAGSLNAKDWAGMFDVEFDRTGVYTLGGFVTALLGRIPAEGDVADFGNLRLIVLRTKGHRVTEVALEMAEENIIRKEGK